MFTEFLNLVPVYLYSIEKHLHELITGYQYKNNV